MNQESQAKLENAVTALFSSLNVMGGENEIIEVVSKMVRSEHRTLQQNFWRVIKNVAADYSENTRSDCRNQGSIEFTKKISDIDCYLPFV
jgi:hypothetical protein